MKYVLCFYIGTFCSMCAVTNMAVFCNSLISCFPGMLHRYCLSDFKMVPVAPVFASITYPFTFHVHLIAIIRSLHFQMFAASFLFTFLSPETATSINMRIPFLSSPIMMSGSLLGCCCCCCRRRRHRCCCHCHCCCCCCCCCCFKYILAY